MRGRLFSVRPWRNDIGKCAVVALRTPNATGEGQRMKLDRRMSKSMKCIISILALVVLRMAIVPVLHAAEMKPEEIVARHLDSIGTAEVRAGAKSRIVQGTSHYKIRVGAGGELQGTSALVSEGRKSVLMIKLVNQDYRGEQFVTDGEKVSVAATTSSHKWSDLGEFVRTQDQVVREGL